MLAFCYNYADAFDGCVYKQYTVVDFTGSYVRQVKSFNVHKDEKLTIDEVRFKSGISEIYELIDVKNWDGYYDALTNYADQFRKMDLDLSTDDKVLRDIANFDKDLRAFRVWKAAQEWTVRSEDIKECEDEYKKSLNMK